MTYCVHTADARETAEFFFYKIDISDKSFDYLFEQCEVEFITALGIHPDHGSHFCCVNYITAVFTTTVTAKYYHSYYYNNSIEMILVYSIGGLVMFDYQKKTTIAKWQSEIGRLKKTVRELA